MRDSSKAEVIKRAGVTSVGKSILHAKGEMKTKVGSFDYLQSKNHGDRVLSNIGIPRKGDPKEELPRKSSPVTV